MAGVDVHDETARERERDHPDALGAAPVEPADGLAVGQAAGQAVDPARRDAAAPCPQCGLVAPLPDAPQRRTLMATPDTHCPRCGAHLLARLGEPIDFDTAAHGAAREHTAWWYHVAATPAAVLIGGCLLLIGSAFGHPDPGVPDELLFALLIGGLATAGPLCSLGSLAQWRGVIAAMPLRTRWSFAILHGSLSVLMVTPLAGILGWMLYFAIGEVVLDRRSGTASDGTRSAPRDPWACPRCQHDTSVATDRRCSECGAAVTMRWDPIGARRDRWLAALILLPTGVGSVVHAFAAFDPDWLGLAWLATIVTALVWTGLGHRVLVGRQRWCGRSAFLGIGLTLGAHVVHVLIRGPAAW